MPHTIAFELFLLNRRIARDQTRIPAREGAVAERHVPDGKRVVVARTERRRREFAEFFLCWSVVVTLHVETCMDATLVGRQDLGHAKEAILGENGDEVAVAERRIFRLIARGEPPSESTCVSRYSGERVTASAVARSPAVHIAAK